MKDLIKKVLPDGKFWTDAWSLVEGCTPVSPGCAHCWLAGMNRRNLPNLSPGLIDPKTRHFNGKIVCHEDRLDIPLRAKKPRVYAIWSDLFHEGVDEWLRDRAFAVMALSPHHRFIIITKRPHIAAKYFSEGDSVCSRKGVIDRAANLHFPTQWWKSDAGKFPEFSNVTIMVTMEDQQRADERAPYALQIAALGWRVGALCEPLLSHVQLDVIRSGKKVIDHLSWIITGGESGHGARPAHPDWVRSLRDQAQAASVPFMFKQWGEWAPCRDDYPDFLGNVCTDWDLPHCPQSAATHSWGDHVFSLRAGKANTGRQLDGREWLETPQ